MRNKLVLTVLVMVLGVLTFGITACDESVDTVEENGEGEEKSQGTIEIGYNNWAENVAVSNMWKLLLEEEGYEVELVNVEGAMMYTGVAEGDLDIGMEVWIPHGDAQYVEEYGDDFHIQDEWYTGAGLGLVVPEYMVSFTEVEEILFIF